MANPYAEKQPAQFWKLAVSSVPPQDVAPIRPGQPAFPADALIATAGSCFAQNVSKYLERTRLLELLRAEPIGADQPLFSALYGNIYTSRQLLQLFESAVDGKTFADTAWQRPDGTYVDPFRPNIFADGFATPEAVVAARAEHLQAVRRVFVECTTFVFTLGLTESWMAKRDGAVFPLAPGVVSDSVVPDDYVFHNLTYDEILQDMREFLRRFAEVNPRATVLLTVSPVPLTATYTDEHVLVATMHSKSVLRAVCSALEIESPQVTYFPSYEIVAGHYSRGQYYNADMRTITEAGVDHVMRVFAETFALNGAAALMSPPAAKAREPFEDTEPFETDPDAMVICDEESIVKSVGF